MKQTSKNKSLSLKTLNKSNVWDVQENDIFRMLEIGEKDAEIKDNPRKYVDTIKLAFTIELLNEDSELMKSKYERLGYKVGKVRIYDSGSTTWAIKKRPIVRVSDLTYENINHISAAKLVEILDRNFGGGWDSLSQSTKDIIESGFDISTTTLPQSKLHKEGGMYEKKVADGYDVLEIPKGLWVEAIFVKAKPQMEKPKDVLQSQFDDEYESEREQKYNDGEEVLHEDEIGDEADDDEEEETPEDDYNKPDEDDMEPEEPASFDDEEITEENYRTTFDIADDSDDEGGEIDFLGEEN